MELSLPLLEFDPATKAPLAPRPFAGLRFPARAVLCFFQDVLDDLVGSGRLRPLGSVPTEAGRWTVYRLLGPGSPTAVLHPGLGAPLAAAMLEHAIASGGRKFIACGCAGVLDPAIARGTVLLATEAVRDEGTSYHYLPPSRTVLAPAASVRAVRKFLQRRKHAHLCCKTWTTDGFFRETSKRIARRVEEGCSAVEMEAAALFAVARLRRVSLSALLYAMDCVRPRRWRPRGWKKRNLTGEREALFWLAVDACRAL